MVEQRLVRRRGGVVELVHDHDVEMRGVDVPNVGAAETLDRRKNVLEPLGPLAPDPLLAKGCVAQRVPERGTALVDDLLAVGNEQEAAARELLPKPRIVDRRHHRFPVPVAATSRFRWWP